MSNLNRIVIAGASLAGLRAAQTLRAEGFGGEITVIGAESRAPYNRPPLSKGVLDGEDDVALPGAEDLDAEWIHGRRAEDLRAAERLVILDDGTAVPYDGLVIATGARARAFEHRPPGVHHLRTLDDALALRAELAARPNHLTVIGGGFIGSEVASTARRQGLPVTLIDAGRHPMRETLGAHAAQWLARHHERHGVHLVSGVRAAGFEGETRVTAVRLDDNRTIPTDLVVAGTGVVPNTDWLRDSGLELDNGILTTETLFARGHSRIVAAGDVARWPHPHYNASIRIEHWANANEQGALAARNLLAGPEAATPYTAIPSFGTTVHGARIQTAGLPTLGDQELILIDEPDRLAIAFLTRDELVGAVAVNAPKDLLRLKRAIAAHATRAELSEWAQPSRA